VRPKPAEWIGEVEWSPAEAPHIRAYREVVGGFPPPPIKSIPIRTDGQAEMACWTFFAAGLFIGRGVPASEAIALAQKLAANRLV